MGRGRSTEIVRGGDRAREILNVRDTAREKIRSDRGPGPNTMMGLYYPSVLPVSRPCTGFTVNLTVLACLSACCISLLGMILECFSQACDSCFVLIAKITMHALSRAYDIASS